MSDADELAKALLRDLHRWQEEFIVFAAKDATRIHDLEVKVAQLRDKITSARILLRNRLSGIDSESALVEEAIKDLSAALTAPDPPACAHCHGTRNLRREGRDERCPYCAPRPWRCSGCNDSTRPCCLDGLLCCGCVHGDRPQAERVADLLTALRFYASTEDYETLADSDAALAQWEGKG